MNKKELRSHYLNKRNQLGAEDIFIMSQQITENVLDAFEWEKISVIHIFLPIQKKKEINTFTLISAIQNINPKIQVIIPKMEDKNLLHGVFKGENTLQLNSFGVPEPLEGDFFDLSKIQMVFVPLLAFDSNGNRVGYGQGFYDRFLAELEEDTIFCGLNFFDVTQNLIDCESWDIPLDYCFTPQNKYIF